MPKKKTKRVSSFVDKPFDFILMLVTLILLSLGLIMVLSASSPSSLSSTRKPLYLRKKTIYISNNRYNCNAIFIKSRL